MKIYRNKSYRNEQNRMERLPLVFQQFSLNIFFNKKLQSSFRTISDILKATFVPFEASLTSTVVNQICSIDLKEVGQIPD